MAELGPLPMLKDEQLGASMPAAHRWVSASAGTGKTQVLSARVFRLLLNGAKPESILCLTFTKAGAAEMAERVNSRLAWWVRAPATEVSRDLQSLGEPADFERAVPEARKLFARVLDAKGGGLRIQTIHSFCQTLLAAFPVEAGLAPGFQPLDERDRDLLARSTLAELLVAREAMGDIGFVRRIQDLSLRLGEGDAEAFLIRCADHLGALEAIPVAVQPWLRRALDCPAGDIEAEMARLSRKIDEAPVYALIAANRAWGAASGIDLADKAETWLSLDPAARAAAIEDLLSVVVTGKGELRSGKSQEKHDPDYTLHQARIAEQAQAIASLPVRAAFADLLGGALEAGRDFARAFADAKQARGAVDFGDLILRTRDLLRQSGFAPWILYKLDQSIDHILVDEAQDTNADQWAIIAALAESFFAPEDDPSDHPRPYPLRTLFSVGDFKQAIFSFQGSDPYVFESMLGLFLRQAELAEQDFKSLSLNSSYRSAQTVLDAVDAVVEHLGAGQLGLEPQDIRHFAALDGPGEVILTRPIMIAGDDTESDGEGAEDPGGEEGWTAPADRVLADRIAAQIGQWIDDKMPVGKERAPVRPGDIMVLVRSRRDLAALIVARLHAANIPVAGIDRLRLNGPLAVQDLLACLRFVLQPGDDLSLASILVSPLIGWSQEELRDAAIRREKATLWAHVRDRPELDTLHKLLSIADFDTPYRTLEYILSGPMDGRRKLMSRLGEEARDPTEELLNAALRYQVDHVPGLQGFLDWIDRADSDVKREPGESGDAVRILTAHGAKGLEAPIVILADATLDPDRLGTGEFGWLVEEEGRPVPTFRPKKAELYGSLEEQAALTKARDLQEHYRLLYVAMTRARERLVITGALRPSTKGKIPPHSWYQAAADALEPLAGGWEEQPGWGEVLRLSDGGAGPAKLPKNGAERGAIVLPDWLRLKAPDEARPPRPLIPSKLGEDDVPEAPAVDAMAARRGVLIHRLFEAGAFDRAQAERWLTKHGIDPDEAEAMLVLVESITADPAHAAIFGPDALAEVPIAAVAEGVTVAGTVDRLVVSDNVVQVVDFKTGRFVPANAEAVPRYTLRQMAAYRDALRVIFPGRQVTASLLYTSRPFLIDLPDTVLDAHKPGLAIP